jgi:hypothetical protein
MAEQLGQLIEERLRIPQEQAILYIRRTVTVLAALIFVLFATMIVAFDSIFVGINSIALLKEGDITPHGIVAPPNGGTFVSEVRTKERQQIERETVQVIYFPPDPDVARRQSDFAQQTLDFVDNVRAAPYDTREQQLADLAEIITIHLSDDNSLAILQLSEDTWNDVKNETLNVLSRVMRQEIRPDNVDNVRGQLVIQVNSRLNQRERNLIVDIVDDLVLPNTFENQEATAAAAEQVASAVQAITRSFVGGEIIVRENERIDALAYEALVALNLLQPADLSFQQNARAFIASTITMVMIGLYMARFTPHLLYHEARRLALVAAIFLLMLAMTRFLGVDGDIYWFPVAALALLYVAIAGPHIAVISSVGLAILTGIMANDSLEVMILVVSGGIIGTLGLRRAERLNQFFVAGALISTINAGVVVIFNLAATNISGQIDIVRPLFTSIISGFILAPATAIAAMYILTQLFNLPTALKLLDLSQPNKPLLQRLLREAPGTYQHSLQVANLSEQAASAINADAQLTHVAALYHDIGKMNNPLYFTENQQDIGNPHDILNDPYRSADIIIGHVTEGDELAKQYGLPQRIRDFVREHHGTTQVFVFYQQALNAAEGNESAVDINDFTYPGPRPQSKETAILMLADSCEAAVRSVKPQSKQEISDLVGKIVDSKRTQGQLDDSGLTLNDLRAIRLTFADILQGMFHPRINYREAINKKSSDTTVKAIKPKTAPVEPVVTRDTNPKKEDLKLQTASTVKPPSDDSNSAKILPKVSVTDAEIFDEEPIAEVPRLPSLDARKNTGTSKAVLSDNGDDSQQEKKEKEVDEL